MRQATFTSHTATFQDLFPGARTAPHSAVDAAVRHAIELSFKTTDAPIIGLPPPVRLRACGALQAWTQARQIAGPAGRVLEARLKDTAVPPLGLLVEHQQFIEEHCSFEFDDPFAKVMLRHSVLTLYRQAFWARDGALYEPTPALHRLLEHADVAHDVPIDLIRLPAPAVCIVPSPTVRDAEQGFQAMMVFEHAPPADSTGLQRCLTFVLHGQRGDEAVVLGIRDATQSLPEAFHDALSHFTFSRSTNPQVQTDDLYGTWCRHLDYVVKVLLYAELHGQQVNEQRTYSNASRTFPGLGKRKRELRMAEVEQLYDRYIVGPLVLAEPTLAHAGDEGGSTVAPHWRRGHFRLQPHGPRASLRKVMFIAPTVVRADRL